MDINSAKKFFIGIQLMVENGRSLVEEGNLSRDMRAKVNNIVLQGEKIESKLWGNMGDDAVVEFNKEVAKVEEACGG